MKFSCGYINIYYIFSKYFYLYGKYTKGLKFLLLTFLWIVHPLLSNFSPCKSNILPFFIPWLYLGSWFVQCIAACRCFPLVATEHTNNRVQQHNHASPCLRACSVQRAARSKIFPATLKAFQNPRHNSENGSPGAPPSQNLPNNSLPVSTCDSCHLSSASHRTCLLRQFLVWEAPSFYIIPYWFCNLTANFVSLY